MVITPCLLIWGREYKTSFHHSFPILSKVQNYKGGGQKKWGGKEKYTSPLEKIKHQKKILRENYFLLSDHLFRQPYCKWAQFSADKENKARSNPLQLWARHKFDRRFQCDCVVLLFFITGIWRARVSTGKRIQKLSTIALTAKEKIQVPKPKLCRMMQFMICPA